MYVIYLVTNGIDGKQYVGFTTKLIVTRWAEHKSTAKHSAKNYFHKAIRKHGNDNFLIKSLKTGEDEEWGLKVEEPYYIAMYRTNDPQWGYNLTGGGEGILGASLETRCKIGKSAKGRVHSEESKQKRRTAMTGKKLGPLSLETRQKMSDAATRRKWEPFTLAHREHISKAKFGKPRKSKPLSEKHKLNIAKARLGKKYGPYGANHSDITQYH